MSLAIGTRIRLSKYGKQCLFHTKKENKHRLGVITGFTIKQRLPKVRWDGLVYVETISDRFIEEIENEETNSRISNKHSDDVG